MLLLFRIFDLKFFPLCSLNKIMISIRLMVPSGWMFAILENFVSSLGEYQRFFAQIDPRFSRSRKLFSSIPIVLHSLRWLRKFLFYWRPKVTLCYFLAVQTKTKVSRNDLRVQLSNIRSSSIFATKHFEGRKMFDCFNYEFRDRQKWFSVFHAKPCWWLISSLQFLFRHSKCLF